MACAAPLIYLLLLAVAYIIAPSSFRPVERIPLGGGGAGGGTGGLGVDVI